MWRRKTESKEIPPLIHSSAQRPSGEPGERNINRDSWSGNWIFCSSFLKLYIVLHYETMINRNGIQMVHVGFL